MSKRLEINGVRFSLDEVTKATIRRNGVDIELEKPKSGAQPIGFRSTERPTPPSGSSSQ